jgi:hypothetical protein
MNASRSCLCTSHIQEVTMSNIASIFVSILFLLFAVGLFVANRRGSIANETLSRWSNITSILAFVLAVVIFVLPQLTNLSNTATVEEDKAAVNAIINLEVKSAVELDLVTLESLYTKDAVVVDRHGTPNDEIDDILYTGWENIRKHYIGLRITYEPQTMSLVNLNIDVVGNKATATHSGVMMDNDYREDLSIYTLEKRNGHWLITKLEFGLKPSQ